jgi:tetratricopeptide (TPR) repeat protein
MRVRSVIAISMLAAVVSAASALAQTAAPLTSPVERAALHAGPEWQVIAPHLPDPQTATPAALEQAGDVLRARRFPEDALDYYGYAMARGGNVSELLNKMGVVRLELQQNDLARQMFLRTVRAKKNDAQAWNNLGVTEFASHNYVSAITDYKRANKIDKKSAVYHSNLAMAYFAEKQMDSARTQFAMAVRLDPSIMDPRESGGATAHVVGSQKYPELCYEMAKVFSREGDVPQVRLWLAKASEGGFDVHEALAADPLMDSYLKDPQVKSMLANSAQMRKRAVASAPGLGEAAPLPSESTPKFITNFR